MSRIAEARARAGHSLRITEEADRWELEQQAAKDLLAGKVRSSKFEVGSERSAKGEVGITSNFGLPPSNFQTTPRWAEAATQQRSRRTEAPPAEAESDRELLDTVRLLFLSPRPVRSVLFCTVPGDAMTDVSWRAAEILATQTRKTVAFVEDPTNRVSPGRSRAAGDLITRIGWYPEIEKPAGPAARGPAYDTPSPSTASPDGLRRDTSPDVVSPTDALDDGLGGHVADLYKSFDFVIANGTAPEAEHLIPFASEVDGVIVLVAEETTPRASAEALVTTLRNAAVDLLGIVYVRSDNAPGQDSQEGLNIRG